MFSRPQPSPPGLGFQAQPRACRRKPPTARGAGRPCQAGRSPVSSSLGHEDHRLEFRPTPKSGFAAPGARHTWLLSPVLPEGIAPAPTPPIPPSLAQDELRKRDHAASHSKSALTTWTMLASAPEGNGPSLLAWQLGGPLPRLGSALTPALGFQGTHWHSPGATGRRPRVRLPPDLPSCLSVCSCFIV